jgi:hypothetical protein
MQADQIVYTKPNNFWKMKMNIHFGTKMEN